MASNQISDATVEVVLEQAGYYARDYAREFDKAWSADDSSDLEWEGIAWEAVTVLLRSEDLTAEQLSWLKIERFRSALASESARYLG